MTDAERIWSEKSDQDLLDAAAELGTYTEEGQRIIREELRRRGFEDPVEQATFIAAEPQAGTEGDDAEDEDIAAEPGAETEGADDETLLVIPTCHRCEIEQRFVGAKRFREGTNWGALGELGHLFEKSESFNVWVCPRCGHVDMFVDGVGEDTEAG